jgi:hypothetical protein
MVEKVDYKVVRNVGAIEIREYPALVIATVRGQSDNTSFRILFDYIQGSNRSKRKVAMTAPVISSEKIAMTAPVVSDGRSFSFLLPFDFTMDSAPSPLDQNIKIEKVPPRKIAVIKFGGRTNEKLIRKKNKELISGLKENNILFKGVPFLMRYNSPFMPGPFRRNEVAVEVL